jgi:hypothetical protein
MRTAISTTNSFTRRSVLAAGSATAAILGSGPALGQSSQQPSAAGPHITLEIYNGIALNELDRWDAVIHPDVKANSPAGRNINGLQTLKRFQKAFATAFRPRVDLIDHYVIGDRGLLTFNMHWTHDGGAFAGIAPTGKGGTSVETALLRIENGKVVRWDVADNSLDLANYLHDQGMKLPTRVELPALIKG